MKQSKLDTVTLPDGIHITGYKNDSIFDSIRRNGDYFEHTWLERWFLPRAGEIACVYDIGANLGNHTVYFAAHAKKANVFSFEPVPVTFELLKTNVEQNGLSDRVKLFQCALGAQEGSAKMQVDGTDRLGFATITENGTQEVAVTRLDDMNLPPPDFVKIDVEDYELEVLKGMERTLRESSAILWIEIHAGLSNNQEKYEFLSSLGYLPIDTTVTDFLFAKKPVNSDEKAKLFCAFIPILQQEGIDKYSKCNKKYKNSRSYKLGCALTAPLRAVRSIFKRL